MTSNSKNDPQKEFITEGKNVWDSEDIKQNWNESNPEKDFIF